MIDKKSHGLSSGCHFDWSSVLVESDCNIISESVFSITSYNIYGISPSMNQLFFRYPMLGGIRMNENLLHRPP